jgi:ADP-heptose:LPS heptosyltransferase
MKPAFQPRRILMLKSQSAGIGDLLRGSAAWRALKNNFPGVELHLLFLTREPGYGSERFIARHHLLSSFRSLDKRTKGFAGWRKLFLAAKDYAQNFQPDLIIDFEAKGARTSLLAFLLGRSFGATTVGINEVPLRGAFYDLVAVSNKTFARQRGLPEWFEYTNRDFVALSALGIERGDTAIELEETAEGRTFREEFRRRHGLPENARLLGLNIGCGTAGAITRRPSLPLLSKLAAHLEKTYALHLVVGLGSPSEAELDREFVEIHQQDSNAAVTNLEGKTSLLELSGVIKACDLFVSGDTGPYHMAVGLRTPTLAVFNHEYAIAYHSHPWVKCVVASNLSDASRLIRAADELLAQSVRSKS